MISTRRSLPVSSGAVASGAVASGAVASGAVALASVLALVGCTTPPSVTAPARPPVVLPPPVVIQSPPKATPPAVAPAQPTAVTPVFTPSTFAALPGWQDDDLRLVWPAYMKSCGALGRKEEWKQACAMAGSVAADDSAAVRSHFETWFVPNLVRAADGADSGLITGYYEAALRGARKRGGAYQTALYGVPDDLLTIDLTGVYPELKGKRLRGRLDGKKIMPYSSRAELAAAPRGRELLYVDDPVEAFFLEVQGSGRVVLDSGETVRVSYADQNGHPYKAIGRWLIEQGELTPETATAQSIKAWIAAHPERRQELFNANPSFVFFREERLPDPSVGPKGALGVPLTPGRSVAIDPSMLPLGAPVYLSTTDAGSDVPLRRLMMGQDTGGAIRGAVRADFFFGFGNEAMDKAGRMKQAGQLWVLLPKQAAN